MVESSERIAADIAGSKFRALRMAQAPW